MYGSQECTGCRFGKRGEREIGFKNNFEEYLSPDSPLCEKRTKLYSPSLKCFCIIQSSILLTSKPEVVNGFLTR